MSPTRIDSRGKLLVNSEYLEIKESQVPGAGLGLYPERDAFERYGFWVLIQVSLFPSNKISTSYDNIRSVKAMFGVFPTEVHYSSHECGSRYDF
jgi:hypothetical protein